jgi:ATP-binding cassette subfamily F protein uup
VRRVCNEIIELDNGKIPIQRKLFLLFREKRGTHRSENASVDKAQNLLCELEWMRRQPKARTTKSKSRQDDFL